MPKKVACLKIPKKMGEKAIAQASKMGLMDKTLLIRHGGEEICVPLIRQPDETELAALKKQLPNLQLATGVFTEKNPQPQTLTQALEGKLPPSLLVSLPQAFDIIGDIVVIDIPQELKPHEAAIGQAILQTHRSVKTVLAKAGDIGGVFRIRDYMVIAGEPKTATIHREFGCQFYVDLARAYFSPRLSHEHMRVAELVGSGEVVADLFAGVGPFSVLIGKKQPSAKVYAVDLNPDAVELLKINVRVNRVVKNVFPIQADAREIAQTQLRGAADRVIMNLPETAIDYVDAACNAIKPEGGIIHFYAFIRKPDTMENLKGRFSEAVEKSGRKVEAFFCAKSIRETAPFESQIVLDAKIV
jgi:tRNA (guanine37-N1)-methyltransferase